MSNVVYVGTSLDGYIADRNGKLDWLQSVPNPDGSDFGFAAFVDSVDAILMGRTTYEVVLAFGGDWPYSKPVFVLTSTLESIPENLVGKVQFVSGTPESAVDELNTKGMERIYVDGGQVIQGLLAKDRIDELILTQIPILLGGGTRLFGDLPEHQMYDLVKTEPLLGAMVQAHYKRKR